MQAVGEIFRYKQELLCYLFCFGIRTYKESEEEAVKI